jgi:hypothetical protein
MHVPSAPTRACNWPNTLTLLDGGRYAGVDGYKDDGMNTYRAQAIRKDILDWDVDDTTLDNATLADPTVVLGLKLLSLLAPSPVRAAPSLSVRASRTISAG